MMQSMQQLLAAMPAPPAGCAWVALVPLSASGTAPPMSQQVHRAGAQPMTEGPQPHPLTAAQMQPMQAVAPTMLEQTMAHEAQQMHATIAQHAGARQELATASRGGRKRPRKDASTPRLFPTLADIGTFPRLWDLWQYGPCGEQPIKHLEGDDRLKAPGVKQRWHEIKILVTLIQDKAQKWRCQPARAASQLEEKRKASKKTLNGYRVQEYNQVKNPRTRQ